MARRKNRKKQNPSLVDELYEQAVTNKDPDLAREIIQKEPTHVPSMLFLAETLLEKKDSTNALQLLKKANTLDPDNEKVLKLLERESLRTNQLHDAICAAYRLIRIRPGHHEYLRRIAGLFELMNYEEHSRYWGQKAASARPLRTCDSRSTTRLKLLVLRTEASGAYRYSPATDSFRVTEGHNNLAGLLDKEHITVQSLCVDALKDKPGLASTLPKVDLVYNSITDPDRCKEALKNAEKICRQLNVPVINHPKQVMQCTREGNWERLNDAPGIIMPKSICLGEISGNISDTIRDAAREHGLKAPVIMRAGGYQGGKHMHLIEDLDNLNVTLQKPAVVYLIEYVDVSFTDDRAPGVKLYPKYRAMLAGGKLFPAHRFVAMNDFNVHRKNWDQAKRKFPWLIDAQQKYLDDPENRFEPGKWRELEQALTGLDLDYLGVDCAPDQKGNMVIFETNPAMRNRLTEHSTEDPVQHAWVHITWAMHELFCQKAGVKPWDFQLPGGSKPEAQVSIAQPVEFKAPQGNNKKILMDKLQKEANDFSDSEFFNTRYYIDEELIEAEARKQGYEVIRHPGRVLEIRDGEKYVPFTINTPCEKIVHHSFCRDKQATKDLLAKHGLPVPQGRVFQKYEEALKYFNSREVPQVVKPLQGFASKGVSAGIVTSQEFKSAFAQARKIGPQVLVEDYVEGDEVRIYLLDGKVVAANAKVPAHVIGNGRDSIKTLVDKKNEQRKRNPLLYKYPVQDLTVLKRKGVGSDYVPEENEWIRVGELNNFTHGASHVAILDQLHPDTVALFEKIAGNLPRHCVCSIDPFIKDFCESPENGNVIITEVDSTPGISQHTFPCAGEPKDMAAMLISHAMENLAKPITPKINPKLDPAPEYVSSCEGKALNQGHFLQNEVIYRAAFERNLSLENLNNLIFKISNDRNKVHFYHGMSDYVLKVARHASNNKKMTRNILQKAEINTPKGKSFDATEIEVAWEYAKSLSGFVVVKPQAGSHGKGITMGIKTKYHFEQGWHEAVSAGSRQIMVESFIKGQDYRVLVVGDTVIAAVLRHPAQVIGDGKSSILELIEEKNKSRRKDPYHESRVINITPGIRYNLSQQNMDEHTILGKDQVYQLHQIANISLGGEAQDVTEDVHPGFVEYMCTAKNLFFNPVHAGIDLVAEDITQAPETQSWGVVEVNLNPLLPLHYFPWYGKSRDVAGVLIDFLFPEQEEYEPISKLFLIKGKVQKVGYRNWMWKQMHLHALKGWVRNLSDGRVEAVVHGPPNAVNHLHQLCYQGPQKAQVKTVEYSEWTGEIPRSVEKRQTK